MKKLETILIGINSVQIIGKIDLFIRDISRSSDNIDRDFLFVAIKGNNSDGHDYINIAIGQGASTILCEIPPDNLVQNITYILYQIHYYMISDNNFLDHFYLLM